MTTSHKIEARPTAHVFRAMRSPAVPGELRTRTWRLPLFQGGKEEHDPLWIDRAADYWQRQMMLYGYVVGDFTLMADVVDNVPVITTAATVLAVLPGERVDDYQLPDKAN